MKSYGLTPPCVRVMAMETYKSNGHGDINETYNFSLRNTYQGLQQIQEISFKMKQEPSKITMKEVHTLETNSSTKMRNPSEWAEMNKIKIKR